MADYTFVGGGGIIFRAPVGTALPTNTNGCIPSDTEFTSGGWSEVGIISDSGLAFKPTRSTKDVPEWGGSVIRTIVTSHSEEATFALDDFTANGSIKAAFGDESVTKATATANHGNISKVEFDDTMSTEAAWAFLMDDGGKTVLVYMPKSVVTGWEAINFKSDDISKHGLTVKATKYGDGATCEMWSDDGQKVTA